MLCVELRDFDLEGWLTAPPCTAMLGCAVRGNQVNFLLISRAGVFP